MKMPMVLRFWQDKSDGVSYSFHVVFKSMRAKAESFFASIAERASSIKKQKAGGH
jgi:hypothetical protein